MKTFLTLLLFLGLDGKWWKAASPDLRDGAVDGLFDCLKWDRGEKLPAVSGKVFARKIDGYYQRHPASTSLEVVLLSLPRKSPKPTPGGEDFSKEKHGYFDRQYWEAEGSTLDQRKGFVTGYVFCRTKAMPDPKTVDRVVEQVHQWYASHNTGQLEKVADVMKKIGAVAKESN